MLCTASRCCCKHSSKIFEQHDASVKSFAQSLRHEFVTVTRGTDCFRESTKDSPLSFRRGICSSKIAMPKIFMGQAAIRHRRDDSARCSAFCFPYWQSYLPCAYTQWLSLWSSGRSVGRSYENDCHEFSQRPRRADGFVTPPATSIACKHTRILHHAKHPALSPHHVRCVHARLRTALVEKRIFALWVARCNEISRQRRTYIWLLPDLSHSAFNPVNISKLISHITWEHTQTQDFPILAQFSLAY